MKYSNFPIAIQGTNKGDLKAVEKLFLDLLERNEPNKSISKEDINQSKMDKPSSSKLPSSIEEIKEAILNEDTVKDRKKCVQQTDVIRTYWKCENNCWN
ncbi:hypothetical protein O181_011718 [Austropuccinia psidii MF-1]|uniref:Uncharacterized protein n=1 Tax=Austropuccinia psidii MF-1 TaxID=1389203 RepID=A0A9Q3BVT9_9BASI|nr:hypothetical protein [Austropuccinia psidii MF-1]